MMLRNLSILTLIAAVGSMHASAEKKNYVAYKVIDLVNASPYISSEHIARMDVDDATTVEDYIKYVTSRYKGYNLTLSTDDKGIFASKIGGRLKYTEEAQKTTQLKNINGITFNGSLNHDDYLRLPGYEPVATAPLRVSIISKEQ